MCARRHSSDDDREQARGLADQLARWDTEQGWMRTTQGAGSEAGPTAEHVEPPESAPAQYSAPSGPRLPAPPPAPDSWEAVLSAEPPPPRSTDPWATTSPPVALDDPEQELWTPPEDTVYRPTQGTPPDGTAAAEHWPSQAGASSYSEAEPGLDAEDRPAEPPAEPPSWPYRDDRGAGPAGDGGWSSAGSGTPSWTTPPDPEPAGHGPWPAEDDGGPGAGLLSHTDADDWPADDPDRLSWTTPAPVEDSWPSSGAPDRGATAWSDTESPARDWSQSERGSELTAEGSSIDLGPGEWSAPADGDRGSSAAGPSWPPADGGDSSGGGGSTAAPDWPPANEPMPGDHRLGAGAGWRASGPASWGPPAAPEPPSSGPASWEPAPAPEPPSSGPASWAHPSAEPPSSGADASPHARASDRELSDDEWLAQLRGAGPDEEPDSRPAWARQPFAAASEPGPSWSAPDRPSADPPPAAELPPVPPPPLSPQWTMGPASEAHPIGPRAEEPAPAGHRFGPVLSASGSAFTDLPRATSPASRPPHGVDDATQLLRPPPALSAPEGRPGPSLPAVGPSSLPAAGPSSRGPARSGQRGGTSYGNGGASILPVPGPEPDAARDRPSGQQPAVSSFGGRWSGEQPADGGFAGRRSGEQPAVGEYGGQLSGQDATSGYRDRSAGASPAVGYGGRMSGERAGVTDSNEVTRQLAAGPGESDQADAAPAAPGPGQFSPPLPPPEAGEDPTPSGRFAVVDRSGSGPGRDDPATSADDDPYATGGADRTEADRAAQPRLDRPTFAEARADDPASGSLAASGSRQAGAPDGPPVPGSDGAVGAGGGSGAGSGAAANGGASGYLGPDAAPSFGPGGPGTRPGTQERPPAPGSGAYGPGSSGGPAGGAPFGRGPGTPVGPPASPGYRGSELPPGYASHPGGPGVPVPGGPGPGTAGSRPSSPAAAGPGGSGPGTAGPGGSGPGLPGPGVPGPGLPGPGVPGPGAAPAGPPPTVEQLTAQSLLRQRRPTPQTGWRRAVYNISAHTVNPGQSTEDRRRLELIARASVPVPGCYRIAVISLKGGVGKTTTTVTLGATLASLRGDRVIAVDANPDRGTLSGKIPLETVATVRNLLNDVDHIQHYFDVRRYTSQSADRLEVLASESDPAVSTAFSEADYRTVASVLERFYNIVLTDCGTGLLHSAMAGVLDLADQIVLVSSGSVDGARSASATLDWLEAHGRGELVRNSVAVINSVRPKSGGVDLDRLEAHFAARCRAVTRIPYDPHLEEGAEVDLGELSAASRSALLELAAAVADAFPRERRPIE